MIEIKHLKTLQALRNCGSLAAAAATLHQTQSALSHQFSDLEQRLGFRLFVRKPCALLAVTGYPRLITHTRSKVPDHQPDG